MSKKFYGLGRRELWSKGWYFLKSYGVKKTWEKFRSVTREKLWESERLGADNESRYRKWWKSQILSSQKELALRKKAERFDYRPKISVLVPVYNTPARWLEKCLRSVEKQLYSNWELCVSDDASSNEETLRVLKRWEEKSKEDERIKIFRQKKNLHISLTTNRCLKMAAGEFVTLLDHDDELHPAALYLVAGELNKNGSLDFIYSDEDKLDENGNHCDPYFKPDWNPDLLLSANYICHLAVIRKKIMEKLGGMRGGFEGSQDYDLFLRLAERTGRIAHIPHVLYHWRKIKGSTSFAYQAKGYADKASILALQDAGKRRGENWKTEKGLAACSFRVRRPIKNKQKVSIIIPFRDKAEMLQRCVSSVLEKTDYPNYELVLVDNGSEEAETKRYISDLSSNLQKVGSSVDSKPTIKILKYPRPFNFSAINNWAVKKTDSPWILFLNNDISVINRNWLSAMAEHVQRPEVGAVGAKLLYPDDSVQHAGVVLGVGRFKDKPFGVAGHAFKYFPKGSHGYFEQIDVVRDCSAVTAACMLVKREIFEKSGGFNEKDFSVTWNDVDYCLRLREKGYLVVYTPYARLYHYESISRGSDDRGEKVKRFHRECEAMYRKWGKKLANDPYYNPNLSLENEGFRIGHPHDLQ